jgi:hypothetical protein
MNGLGLSDKLSDQDCGKDLSLSSSRNSTPCIKGLHSRERLEGNVGGEHTWEMNSSSLNNVSSGGKHGNTRMLELRSTEPSEGLIRSKGSKVERIKGSDGVGGSGQVGEVSIFSIKNHGSLGCSSGCESSSGSDESEAENRLHFDVNRIRI